MFAKTKCLMVLNRTGRYVQSRSIRKSSQLKYSAASIEGLSPKLQVKRSQSQSHSHNLVEPAEEACDLEAEVVRRYNEPPQPPLSSKVEYPDPEVANRKIKLGEIVKRAEELLGCRFYKSISSSVIGVGILNSDSERQQYFNLLPDWFQTDSELTNTQIPTLLGSGHPLLKLKQNVDPDAEEHSLSALSNNIQWRALIAMLVSKSFGHPRDLSQERRKLLEARQITLSEITEMMYFAFSLHRTIVEIKRSKTTAAMEGKESALHLGNKIALLFGDLLLARTSKGLSSIKNAKVTELMSDAISDFSESEILRRRQLDFFKPSRSGSSDIFKELTDHRDSSSNCIEVPSYDSWKQRVDLDLASLVGRACLCSTLISQLDEGASNLAFSIGRHMGLLMQAYDDLELYIRSKNLGQPVFDLCTLPLVFHFSNNSVDRIHKPSDISEIYRDILTSPVALLQTQEAVKHLKSETLVLVSKLPKSTPAPMILENFISTLS